MMERLPKVEWFGDGFVGAMCPIPERKVAYSEKNGPPRWAVKYCEHEGRKIAKTRGRLVGDPFGWFLVYRPSGDADLWMWWHERHRGGGSRGRPARTRPVA